MSFAHIPGKQNVVADALSRPPEKTPTPMLTAAVSVPACKGINYMEMAKLQQSCEEVAQLALSESLKIQKFDVEGLPLLCDVSAAMPRPLVPVVLRRKVFEVLHDLAHPGRRATIRLVST